ncbi:MAG: glutamine-hydrolyzing GMP synthase, partial [Bifidobacteriaceae bacterium]|nr:glutamine-hydrolyzing GMP synthase [Bifidobacteriaceae bacterium]
MTSSLPNHKPVLVVDFGAQYAQLIARRVREAHVYSQIVPHTWPVSRLLELDPAAIILSGGPASVYEADAPRLDPALLEAGIPVLGICYGFQAMAYALGGRVDRGALGEYGATMADAVRPVGLLASLPRHQTVWMSHGVAVSEAPAGFEVLALTAGAPVAAFQDRSRRLYGVQWHPEVRHTPLGQATLENFLFNEASLRPDWTPGSIVDEQVAAIRRQIGAGRVICGLSGGVDSSVAAALVQRAVGDQLTCVFVDHGLLREGEREQVERDFVAVTGAKLVVFDARQTFLEALAGVVEPEAKRKIIGREFIRAFEAAARLAAAPGPGAAGSGASGAGDSAAAAGGEAAKFLVQGTLYPDVVESGGGEGAAGINSHHKVGEQP